MQELLSVGKILNFQGLKGEVKVGFTEGNENLFFKDREIYAEKNSQIRKLEIEKVRFHKKIALIKFKEINSIDEAIDIKGSLLKLPKDELAKELEEDEFYISDLVGIEAYDIEGNYLGVISGSVNIKHQDTLFIKTEENKEYLVPFTKELVPDINLKERKVIINKIEGLFEK